jgi:hypothetical protein
MSESAGMRQLQQTVERLANRVSVASAEIETNKCELLQRSIDDLETQLLDIDKKISDQNARVRRLLEQPDGEKLIEISSSLIESAPWLTRALPSLEVDDVIRLHKRLQTVKVDKNDPILAVTGFELPPRDELVSVALARSGSSFSQLADATRNVVASMPLFGSMTGMDLRAVKVREDIDKIKIKNSIPESEEDWKTVASSLKLAQRVHAFE